MDPKEKMKELATQCAINHSIEPAWVRAIVSVESSWEPLAVRFEPGYQWVYEIVKSAKLAQVSLDTESATQKMSWGLGQIMGALAREQGLTGPLPKLLTPEVNLEHICIRIKHLKNISNQKDDIFAAYNGGVAAMKKIEGKYRNQKYVDNVNTFLTKEG